MTVTHIAAPHIVIDDRWMRQRCGWCGVVLLDYDLDRVAVPTGTDPTPATWEMGALVTVDGPASWTADVDRLPDDACARGPGVSIELRSGGSQIGDLVTEIVRRAVNP